MKLEEKGLRIGEKQLKVPIIQGGMGVGISLGRLAGSVAKEGAVGIISAAQIGYQEPEFDTDARKANLRAIEKEMEKATVIMISHRITSLMQADCIIVMDKGVIQQMGTHEELIHQEGPYKDIYEIQMNSDIRLMEGGAACE